jgi:hypothetical protein
LLEPREEYLQTDNYDQQAVRRREAAMCEEDEILSDVFAVDHLAIGLVFS